MSVHLKVILAMRRTSQMSNQREFVDPNDLNSHPERPQELLNFWWDWINDTTDAWYIIENKAGQQRKLIRWRDDDRFVEPTGGGKYQDYESPRHCWGIDSAHFRDCIVTAKQLHKAGWVFVGKRRKLSFKSIIRDLLLISGSQHASSNYESVSQGQSGSQAQSELIGTVLEVVSKTSS